MSTKVISQITVRRLISDIKELKKNPLSKDGIYYKHHESNILEGYALIIGPSDTPYEYGNFLFKFNFPDDYPYSPPIVKYYTNDGETRFHPNLYKNGKVCLSLLNTWKGEQWTGCQTIKSILLVICSILNKDSLTNEPGISHNHKDVIPYNKIIKYKTVDVAIAKILNRIYLPEEFNIFYSEIRENFVKNYDKIIESIVNTENEIITTGVYNLRVKTYYNKLLRLLKNIYENNASNSDSINENSDSNNI